jgi:hypothetical protein
MLGDERPRAQTYVKMKGDDTVSAKPVVFISHVHEDSNLAKQIADQIRQAFLNAVEVFVASDGSSIKGGDKWMQKIEDGLRLAQIVLVLVTRNSVGRKWVYFETGGAFFLGARVIPLLDGSISINQLGPPLNYLQCCLMSDAIHLKHVYTLIAERAGMAVPAVDFTALTRQFKQAAPPAPQAKDVGDQADQKAAVPGQTERDPSEIVEEILKRNFVAQVAQMKSRTGEERDAAERAVNQILDGVLPEGPPKFIEEWFRDKCISEGQLYMWREVSEMISEKFKEFSKDEQVQIVLWLGQLLNQEG